MYTVVLPILICVVLPVTIVWLALRARQHAIDKKAEIMLKAIESGATIDPEYFKKNEKPKSAKKELLDKLSAACITSLLGVAFLVAGLCFKAGKIYFAGEQIPFFPTAGAILLGIGIALFIVYFVGKKMFAKEIEAEEKALEETKQ
jgi:hypothetical protein